MKNLWQEHMRLEIVSKLQAGRDIVGSMPHAIYVGPAGGNRGGSVGAHMRHILDYCDIFIAGLESRRVDYDARRRGTIVERDPRAAIEAIDRTCVRLEGLSAADLAAPLEVRVRPDVDPGGTWARSSALRELEFLLGHTIHHYALIALLCERLGFSVPADFGMAPSTLRYLASLGVCQAS